MGTKWAQTGNRRRGPPRRARSRGVQPVWEQFADAERFQVLVIQHNARGFRFWHRLRAFLLWLRNSLRLNPLMPRLTREIGSRVQKEPPGRWLRCLYDALAREARIEIKAINNVAKADQPRRWARQGQHGSTTEGTRFPCAHLRLIAWALGPASEQIPREPLCGSSE